MLRINNLVLARGARRLLDGAALAVHAGHKVGIVGPNGAGKSSLFALLLHELVPESGTVDMPSRWTIAHVAQDTPAVDRAAIDFVLDGDRELRSIEAALARFEPSVEHLHHTDGTSERDGHALAELHHRFDVIGGYSARARAGTLLSGLGFPTDRHQDLVPVFSGGWRMRLNLAQALMCRSDLLLLDEPTNHLDLDAVMWLEDWLARYPGTLLLITHDRDFLDAVVGSIVHFDQQKLKSYTGNYSQFEQERAGQLALQQATFNKQRRQIAHLQSFVDRFRAKATKAKQAQSRIKALERMERIAAAHVDSPFEFSFAPVGATTGQLMRLERATIGYGAQPIINNIEWSLLKADRIGLLGPNGAGKSTLLKSIAGTLPLIAGERHVAPGLRVGYFAQHQVDALRLDESPLWHLRKIEPGTREQAFRDFLGGFDFRGDMATAAVRTFSGGEKARLTLALLVRQRPNLLLLDEPTNHLDIEMREALAEALQDYDGALIVVAHDRHLLRACTDALWLVNEGRVTPFDGDLDDYRDWVLGQARRALTKGAKGTDKPPFAESAVWNRGGASVDRKEQRRADAQWRQQRSVQTRPLTSELARIERDMSLLSEEKHALEAWLASEDAYREEGRDLLKARIARQGDLTWQLARLETAWLETSETLEKLKDG